MTVGEEPSGTATVSGTAPGPTLETRESAHCLMRPRVVLPTMSTRVDARERTGSRDGRYVPAYGPVDAALGYALFYVVVDRATPTVVDVFGGVLGDVTASSIRLGLAAFLWFVLVVTAVDQARRQLAALGVVGDGETDDSIWSPAVPSETQALAYVVLVVLGGLVAAWTFEGAIGTLVSLIRGVAALDPGAFVLGEFLVMALFFLSFEAATYAADRLLVGGTRAMLIEDRGPGDVDRDGT